MTTRAPTVTTQQQGQCNGLSGRPRPNAGSISTGDWNLFVAGIDGLRQKASTRYAGISVFDEFARLHNEFGQHFGSNFLMWHRVMLWEFERQLDSVAPGARIPAYDWSREGSNALRTTLFQAGRAGGSAPFNQGPQPIPNGAFQGLVTNAAGGGNQAVRRQFNYDQPFHSRAAIDSTIAAVGSYAQFNVWLEGIHANFHIAIGGNMNSLSFSPSEPSFYMHHAFIDKIWREWQQAGGGNEFNGQHPANGGQTVNENTRMQPWGTTAKETLERISSCVQYTNPGGGVTSRKLVVPKSMRQEDGVSSNSTDSNGEDTSLSGTEGGENDTSLGGADGSGVDANLSGADENGGDSSVSGGDGNTVSTSVSGTDGNGVPKPDVDEVVVPVISTGEKKGYQYEVALQKIADPGSYTEKVLEAAEVKEATKASCAQFNFPPEYIELFERVESFALLTSGVDLADVEVAQTGSTEEVRQEGVTEKAAIEQGNDNAIKPSKKDEAEATAVVTKDA